MESEMMKSCVILNGVVINIGDWDYQIQSFEVSPTVMDEEGNVTIEAIYEDRATNPLPEGATFEERDFVYSEDRGWYEVGSVLPQTPEERIAELEAENMMNMLALVELHGMILLMGGGK